jgi:hypothetical protein
LIGAALQIEKTAVPMAALAHDQIVDLEGLVYLAPDLADAKQENLRFGLAGRLESADQVFLQGEQRLSQNDLRDAKQGVRASPATTRSVHPRGRGEQPKRTG